MIWVYAICDRPDLPPPRRRGLAHAPLEGVAEGPLLAVISRHVNPPADPALDALWVHDRVVERLMAERTVLPLRFGTRLAGEDDLRAALAARAGELLAALDGVRGRVELGLRGMQPDGDGAASPRGGDGPEPSAPTTGREYLLGKLASGRRDERIAAAVHEPLAGLAVAARRWSALRPGEVLRAAYLVDLAVVPRFRMTVERLQREHESVGLLCTGPWPPYSFVGVDALPSVTTPPARVP